ncbi:tumor protein D52 [Larimichthys crocea]|uniref:tumor protein D52 n=1 Tax=Larimichthys crocea TaxID=215358 RepID=UPI000F5FA8CE|nr:tumor protein D52 [Larimichthys crocea]
MEDTQKGQQPDSVPEMGEDAVTSVNPSPPVQSLSEEERQELQEELFKVEDEIQTLSQVLAAKESSWQTLREAGHHASQRVETEHHQTWRRSPPPPPWRTSETLSQAGLKATAAFSNVGSAISKKLEDVRNAPTFKSFEEKVETLKTKMSPPASSTNPDNQDAANPSTDTLSSQPEDLPTQEMPMN